MSRTGHEVRIRCELSPFIVVFLAQATCHRPRWSIYSTGTMREREGHLLRGRKSDAGQERPLKTFWHHPYADLIKKRKPPGWQVTVDKTLSLAPRSADQLLLCRSSTERRDDEANVMRGLWQHLTDTALLEFKGPTSGLRGRDLHKLISYGAEYLSEEDCVIEKASELSLVLAVPKETPTLRREYERCEVEPELLGGGYVRLVGRKYTMLVVLLDQVANAEHDDFIRVFTDDRAKIKDPKALWWANAWIRKVRTMEELKELEGYEDMVAGLIESLGAEVVLGHFNPEERLAGLDPEERLAGLTPEQLKRLRAALDQKLNGS